MAAESIISYKRLAHPEYRVSDKSVRTDIEYIGPYATLYAPLTSELIRGQPWGDYPGLVSDISIKGIEGTSPAMAELTVSVEYELTDGGGDFGIEEGIESGSTYEIDWTVVMRPLMEHPAFARGSGEFALTQADVYQIEEWERAETEADKTEKYGTLSTNAKKYADGIEQGIQNFEDYAPVLTKTTSYVGGPGPRSAAGHKNNPPSAFPNGPTGYEWVKTADRSLRSGTRDKWDRVEQWSGSAKVLVDKEEIYY